MTDKERIYEKKYSIKETAHLLGVSEITVWREIGRNKLSCYRFGARVLIGEHHIEKYLMESENVSRGKFMQSSLLRFADL
jgi:excisionase family DNA binding protein